MRERMSRPSGSVPSQCIPPLGSIAIGGFLAKARASASGLSGESTPAKIAMKIAAKITAQPNTARRLRQKRYQKLRARERAGCGKGTLRSWRFVTVSAITDPWVEIRIQEIDGKIREHEDDRDEEHTCLDHRVVTRANCLDDDQSNSRPAENGFDDHRAREQLSEL